MAETKWTPGPWSVMRAEKSLDGCRFENGNFAVMAPGDCEDHPIADCSCNHTCRLDDECEANAHLIAAAPDLYDGLDRVLDYLKAIVAARGIEGGAAIRGIEIAEAALSKARGA